MFIEINKANFLLAHKRKLQRKCATRAKFKNKFSNYSLKILVPAPVDGSSGDLNFFNAHNFQFIVLNFAGWGIGAMLLKLLFRA